MSAIGSIQSPAGRPAAIGSMRSAVELQQQSSFARTLDEAVHRSDRQSLRDAAAALVASALLTPAMSALEHSPFRGDGPFAAGPAERRFAPLLYQRLADEVSKAANFPLVDQIVDRLVPRLEEATHASV